MNQDLPILREDLETALITGKGGRPIYLIKDPRSAEVFEFGEEEHFICSRLDGTADIASIQAAFSARFGDPPMPEHLESFIRQLAALGLLVPPVGRSFAPATASDPVRTHRLCGAQPLIAVLENCTRWCFSSGFLLVCLLITALSVGILVKFAGDLFWELRSGLIPTGLLALVPIFMFLVIRPFVEVVKGVACRHHGAQVYAFGFFLRFRVLPQFCADISEAFWCLKKQDRLKIIAAGMTGQVLLTAVALVVWHHTAPGSTVHYVWAVFALTAMVSTVLNLLPIGGRDGGLLLSTWAGEPKLWERSRAVATSWLLRRPMPEPLTPSQTAGFRWYGLCALCFEFLFWGVFLGWIGYALTDYLEGVGAVIFIIILGLRFEAQIKKPFRWLFVGQSVLTNENGGVGFRRLIWICVLGLGCLVLFIPYPFEAGGEFRLLPLQQVGIRAQTTGEVASVLIQEGQWIKKGDPAAILVGRDQRRKVSELEAGLKDLEARLSLLLEGPRPEAVQVAAQEVSTAAKSLEYSSLQERRHRDMNAKRAIPADQYEASLRMRDMDRERLKLAEKNLALVKSGAREKEVEALEAEVARMQVSLSHAREELALTTLRSPAEGRVITPFLTQKVGQHLAVGELFAVVEDARTIIAEIEVPEKDMLDVRIGAGVTLRTWADPSDSFTGTVTAIAPVAYEKSIKRIQRALSDTESRFDQREILRQEGKVVRILCELTETLPDLKTDMTGYAKIQTRSMPVGAAFSRWLVRFIMVEVWSWIP